MNKLIPFHGKHLFRIILSTGILILGAGMICLAGFRIWDQSRLSPVPTFSDADDASNAPMKDAILLQDSSDVNESEEISSSCSTLSETLSASPSQSLLKVLYPVYPTKGEVIGSLSIPGLNKTLPIIEGTGAEELERGVGHFYHSALPGETSNCVLSGHRTTVFSDLGLLKIGEQVTIQTSAGSFTYKIRNIRIVHKDDKTVIVPSDHAILTLTTCYPFQYIGFAPDRYIISADLVENP